MSLLLDALKKASDDKSKIKDLSDESLKIEGENEGLVSKEAVEEASAAADEDKCIVLDLDISEQFENEAGSHGSVEKNSAEFKSFTKKRPIKGNEKVASESHKENAEALSVLINKSNSHYKNKVKNKTILSGLLVSALFICIAVFYMLLMNEKNSVVYTKGITVQKNVKKQAVHIPDIDVANVEKKDELVVVQIKSVKKAESSNKKNIAIQKKHKKDPVSGLINKAYKQYNDGLYENSISRYKEVLSIEKNNIHAWLGLAANNIKLNKPVVAKKYYEQVLTLDPNESYALAGIALINKINGVNSIRSISELKERLVQRPESPQLQFAIASSYATLNKWPSAQKHFYNAWTLNNTDFKYTYNLAVSLDHLGQYPAAIKFYKMSVELDKSNALDQYAIGKRLKKLQEKNND